MKSARGMSGNLVDLAHPDVIIPDLVAVDTNVVIAFLRRAFPGQNPQKITRASDGLWPRIR